MVNRRRKLRIPLEEMMRLVETTTTPIVKVTRKTQAEANAFYKSQEWKDCRLAFLDGKVRICNICQCDLSLIDSPKLNVDHIKPVKHYWHLRTEHSNLQIACEDCNRLKGNYFGDDVQGYISERKESERRRLEYLEWKKSELARVEHMNAERQKIVDMNREEWTKDYNRKSRKIDLDEYLRGRASQLINKNRRESTVPGTVDF